MSLQYQRKHKCPNALHGVFLIWIALQRSKKSMAYRPEFIPTVSETSSDTLAIFNLPYGIGALKGAEKNEGGRSFWSRRNLLGSSRPEHNTSKLMFRRFRRVTHRPKLPKIQKINSTELVAIGQQGVVSRAKGCHPQLLWWTPRFEWWRPAQFNQPLQNIQAAPTSWQRLDSGLGDLGCGNSPPSKNQYRETTSI